MMQEDISDRLVVEEFVQMHEHMRQREEAMNHLLNLTATGTTTLLAAIAAFVFQLAATSPNKLSVLHCYLFLSPLPLLIFGLSMLAAHRHDIYRIGYYLNIFFEERFGGAEWGIRSFRFRELMKGESQDPITFILWSLFLIASLLFIFGLYLAKAPICANALGVAPFLIGMIYQHKNFVRDRRPIKNTWIAVMREQGYRTQERQNDS